MTSVATFNQPVRIIQNAYFEAGKLQEGQEANSEQIARGTNRLNDLINTWQTTGLKLWLNIDTSVTLVAGQRDYTFGPTGTNVMTKPLRVLEAYYELTGAGIPNTRRPITPLAWRDWVTLSQTNTQGQVSQYFVDKQQINLGVSFWLTPDSVAASEGVAKLLFQVQVTNFTGITDTINFPQEWMLALQWALADELAVGQPKAVQDRCQQRAMMYKEILDAWDVEDAPTRFTPDPQTSGMQSSRFR